MNKVLMTYHNNYNKLFIILINHYINNKVSNKIIKVIYINYLNKLIRLNQIYNHLFN
jgi:hypothetical protein